MNALKDMYRYTSYLSPAPPAVQVSKFPGWYQNIPQITVILLTITTLVVVEWWWWHHHHHYNTTTITLYHHHHHSTTTVTIKFSCVAIYAVLLQNYFFPRFTRFWCQIFELKMVLVSKNDKYEV